MAQVELVSVTTSDGVRLDGSLRKPEGVSRLGVDAVILHHGFGGTFYAPSFFSSLQEWLAGQGVAVLRVNSRGHDLAARVGGGLVGGSYEVIEDCVHDWRAWNDFAESLGYPRILLWGHSLGAVKSLYYLANEQDDRVQAAVTSSPPRFSHEDALTRPDGAELAANCARAKALTEEGKPLQLLGAQVPRGFAAMSARTYLDKWGPGERYNHLRLLRQAGVPILVTVGSEEGKSPDAADWLQFGEVFPALTELAKNTPNVTFELLEGANHEYAGKAEIVWDVARRWLAHTVGARTGAR